MECFGAEIANMSALVGTCMTMCPQNEKKMRRESKRVHVLERRDNRDLMVKEFIRAGAGNEVNPSELRPLQILLKTTFYLVNEVIPCKDLPYDEVYNFVFDRFRAIRQDLSIQRLECSSAIKIYEIISRFLIYSNYRLSNMEQFCMVTNMKHIVECLHKLCYLYKAGHSSHTSEFLSYLLLACFGNYGVIMHVLSHPSLRKDGLIDGAFSMNLAWVQRKYLRVLKLTNRLTPLQACIFHHSQNVVRSSLVQVLSFGYCAKNVYFPTRHLSNMLLFDGEDCLDFLVAHGVTTLDKDSVIFNNKIPTIPHAIELLAPDLDMKELTGQMKWLDIENNEPKNQKK